MTQPVADAWWRPLVTSSGVDVSHVDLTPDRAREADALALLDASERSAWRRYMPAPRRRFALCRAALRAVLCGRLGCRNEELSFGVSRHGKPFAVVRGERSRAGFNVSHGGDHGLIALGPDVRVGVDLEERRPRRDLDQLIGAVMGPAERGELAALEGADRLRLFYRIWTFKEALTKALGTGLTSDVSGFEVPAPMRRGQRAGTFTFPHLPGLAWGLVDIGGDAFAAALACELAESTAEVPSSGG